MDADEAGGGQERKARRVADRREERRVDDQVAVRVEVAPERRLLVGCSRERTVGAVEDRLQDDQARGEEQLAAPDLDRCSEAGREPREDDGGRRDAQRQESEHHQVGERPVERLGDELARRSRFTRAVEEGRMVVVSETGSWDERDGALERELVFDGFRDAIAFVDRLADLAESANHHPDISISYKRVTVRWTTHSAGGITGRDREMAARTDELV